MKTNHFFLGWVFGVLFFLMHIPTHSEAFEFIHFQKDPVQSSLQSLSASAFQQLKNLDPEIFPKHTTAEDVLIVNVQEARELTRSIIQNDWFSLDFFAHPALAKSSQMIYFPKEVLDQVGAEFDYATIFQTQGQSLNPANPKSHPQNHDYYFAAQGLILGKGRVVMIYDRPIQIKRSDKPFNFLTGMYAFHKVNIADIESQGRNHLVIRNFRGRNSPDEKMKSIMAPLNLPLKQIKGKFGEKKVQVYAGVFSKSFPQKKIATVVPPLAPKLALHQLP